MRIPREIFQFLAFYLNVTVAITNNLNNGRMKTNVKIKWANIFSKDKIPTTIQL